MDQGNKKMESYHWFMLYTAAIFFDAAGWITVFSGLNEITFGVVGVILNLIAGQIFFTWALLWRDKGIGDSKFFISLGIGFVLEEIPIVGTVLPMWIMLIYRAKKAYQSSTNSSLTGVVASTAKVFQS